MSHNFDAKADAQKWARQLEKKLDADHAAGKLGRSTQIGNVTIHDAVEARIERRKPRGTTQARMRWWASKLGKDKKIADVRRADIREALRKLQSDGVKNAIRGGKAQEDDTRTNWGALARETSSMVRKYVGEAAVH